jgi:hypothetical protein
MVGLMGHLVELAEFMIPFRIAGSTHVGSLDRIVLGDQPLSPQCDYYVHMGIVNLRLTLHHSVPKGCTFTLGQLRLMSNQFDRTKSIPFILHRTCVHAWWNSNDATLFTQSEESAFGTTLISKRFAVWKNHP